MQLSLALVASAAALSSAHVLPRTGESSTGGGNFTLTNAYFTSSTYSKGGGTSKYTFSVSDSLRGGSTTCAASFANNQELPQLNYTACADPTWAFALLKTGQTGLRGQYSLQITRYQVIDGHRTNNETSCNTNAVVDAAPNQDPDNSGATFSLNFGSSNFTQSWAYTSPTKYYCPGQSPSA